MKIITPNRKIVAIVSGGDKLLTMGSTAGTLMVVSMSSDGVVEADIWNTGWNSLEAYFQSLSADSPVTMVPIYEGEDITFNFGQEV